MRRRPNGRRALRRPAAHPRHHGRGRRRRPRRETARRPAPREAAAQTGTAKPYRSAGDDVTFTSDAPLAAGATVGRHDRLGNSWAAAGSPAEGGEPPRCVGSAPFEKVRKGTGDFDVVPWQPRL